MRGTIYVHKRGEGVRFRLQGFRGVVLGLEKEAWIEASYDLSIKLSPLPPPPLGFRWFRGVVFRYVFTP